MGGVILMLEDGEFNLVFDDDNNISVSYNALINEDIWFNDELIEKINDLAKYHKVSITKFFGEILQVEVTRKMGLYVQQAFNEVIDEQYNRMEEQHNKMEEQ